MTTQPDPSRDLADQLADVLAETDRGPGDYRQQAADALAWLDERGRLAPNADPWFTRHTDGRIDAHWPDGVQRALVARELVDQMATQGGELEHLRQTLALRDGELASANAQRDRLRGLLADALDLLPTTCRYHGDDTSYERTPGIDGPCCDTGRTAWAAKRLRQAAAIR